MAYVPHWKRQLAGEGFFRVVVRASSVQFLETRYFDSNAHQIKEGTIWE